MNPKAIHELSLRTIIDGINAVGPTVKDAIDDNDRSRNKKYNNVSRANSIARATEGLVFTYPVLCSTSLDIKSCMLVGKALERRNVTSLQILLAANQMNNKSMSEYLKDFHTNLDFDKIELDSFIDILTDTKPFAEMCNTPQALLDMVPIREKYQMIEDFRNNTNYFFEDDINETCISDFKVMERNGYNTIVEANSSKVTRINTGDRTDIQGNNDFTHYDSSDEINKITQITTDRLISSEVKKANEVVPTLMLVNTIDPNTGVSMQSVIGVKSRIISVPANEMTGRIVAHFENTNYLLKFIKLTTREISFLKDFIFAIDSAKLDAINNSKKGSSSALFRALERRSQGNEIRRMAKTDKQLAKAISTLVLSQEDVENLKKDNNIDVEIPKVIVPIMRKLNLLYFVIVDESSEIVKIFIDGSDSYEEYTFAALDKESKDDSYKKVINLMTKMTR